MKLINSSVEVIKPTGYTLQDIYKQIELAGRTCYKSEDNMTDTSAKDFVNRMVASKHYAMLEHGTVYLSIPVWDYKNMKVDRFGEYLDMNYEWLIKILKEDKYSKHKIVEQKDNEVVIFSEEDLEKRPFHLEYIFITTNYRVIIENKLEALLQYLCEPTEYHQKRITTRFICDRGVSHELVRHRVFSFAQESTRYCNYSKDKFGNELTFIIPSFCKDIPNNTKFEDSVQVNMFVWATTQDNDLKLMVDKFTQVFLYQLIDTEIACIGLLNNGYKPQEVRAMLPNALKTELVMTGFESDWDHFFELRCAKAAHPDMQKLANELKGKFHEKEVDNKDK